MKGDFMKKTTTELLEILKSKKDYSEFLNQEVGEMIFSSAAEYLELMIKDKKLKKSDIIREGNLDRNYAYQIFNGIKKSPSRNKILMISFGMHLNIEETRKLLKLFELSDLYARSPRDGAILFCLNKGMSLIDTNEMLCSLGLEILE